MLPVINLINLIKLVKLVKVILEYQLHPMITLIKLMSLDKLTGVILIKWRLMKLTIRNNNVGHLPGLRLWGQLLLADGLADGINAAQCSRQTDQTDHHHKFISIFSPSIVMSMLWLRSSIRVVANDNLTICRWCHCHCHQHSSSQTPSLSPLITKRWGRLPLIKRSASKCHRFQRHSRRLSQDCSMGIPT